MIRHIRWLCVAMVATLAVASPTRGEVRERWYVVEIAGSPVGFASEDERAGAEGVLLRTHMDLSLSRMGTPLSMFMLVEEACDADGRFVEASMEMTASITGMNARAILHGDTLEYRFETGGSTDARRIAWEAGALSQHCASERVEAWLGSDKAELIFKTFRVDEGRFVETRVVRKSATTTMIDGREQRATVTEEFEDGADVATSTTWYDEGRQAYRTVMRQMGLEIVVERVTPEEMAAIELEPNFDIIRQSMIPCAGYPDPPSRVKDVTLRLEMSHSIAAMGRLDGPNQREIARGDAWVEVLVSRDTVSKETLSDADLAPFLRPDRFIQSEHPAIRAVADSIRAAGRTAGKGDGFELAADIARWVGAHVASKDFTQGFASALEVLETRAGDCTEHSVLLAALLRAAGIPARPVVGLAYSGGQFIGHMWTEAYVDYWRTLDALDPDTDPVRVRIATSDNGEAVDARALLEAYSVVGGMRARVVDHHSAE